jgi:serine/threonine protein kinase
MGQSDDFKGTDRFKVERRLGQGGMGVVYLAFDKERGAKVALKTVTRLSARGIASLKNEFRSLADVTHPNLVALHELVSEGQEWFFTMELVEGVSFLKYVRPGGAPHSQPDATGSTLIVRGAQHRERRPAPADATTEPTDSSAPEPPERPITEDLNVDRLQAALRQLAAGVKAIHAHGKLHCDLKPSNVLVTETGRVVILDFGLAGAYGARRDGGHDRPKEVLGTPSYMAPEQMLGEPEPASDWYAFGVMLYEALTGSLPFSGRDADAILIAKMTSEAVIPAELAGTVPESLLELCTDCLKRLPEERPTGIEILRRLGVASRPSFLPASSQSRPMLGALGPPIFVGREAQLEALRGAFAEALRGETVIATVSGRSGMGKSALIEHFLDELATTRRALVLTGRCFERESVPYKAWDSLIDALSRYLLRLPSDETARLLPADIRDLARVFPVLHNLDNAGPVSLGKSPISDHLESRQRAFRALRDLLTRLARAQPLVLYIDDLQWGDVDSARLLVSLLGPPDSPPLLLIGSYRSDEAETSELFRELRMLERSSAAAVGTRRVEIEIDRLSPEESERLALALLEQGEEPEAQAGQDAEEVREEGAAAAAAADEARAETAAAIAREAEGSPFFIAELVHALQSKGVPSGSAAVAVTQGGVSLDSVLKGRIAELPEDPRRVLEAISVAARPIEQGLAVSAAGIASDESTTLGILRSAHFIRTRGARSHNLAEPYHDRIREAVLASLDPARLRSYHARLARVLEQSLRADPELLTDHFEGAGDLTRAAKYATIAAEKAASALAFGRAATLYRRLLAWAPAADKEKRRALLVDLANVLVNEGHGAEAAPVFLEAAEDAHPDEALELWRRAAEQHLISGHIDEGALTLRAVLSSVDVPYPETTLGATLSLLALRAKLRLRGTSFTERPEDEVPAADLTRIDACYSAGKGLTLVDPVRGLGFFARHLLLSLSAGEPSRVCVGLAFFAINLSTGGASGYARARRILEQARSIADRLDNPYLQGVVLSCEAATQMCLGRWRSTVELAVSANKLLRERVSGAAWEIEGGVVCAEVSLLWMGRLRELASFAAVHAREALERGDLFAATYARMHTWYRPVAADDVTRASEEMREAIRSWSKGGFHIMHFWALYGETQYELYAGAAAAARRRILEAWPALRGSNILSVQFHRVFIELLRGSTAVAAAAAGPPSERASLLRAASSDARTLAGERTHYASPASSLLSASILGAEGRAEASIPHLDAAIGGFDAADMAILAACARRRKGLLLGGDAGRELITGADAFMAGEGIKNPARFTDIYSPGFGGSA